MGRLIRTLRPEVGVTAENGAAGTVRPEERNHYDISGRLIATRDANGHTTRRLLLAGTGHGGSEALVTRQWNADGGVRHQGHDVHGDLRRVTDEIGRVTGMTYDAAGRLITQTRAAGTALALTDSYTYDLLGQRLTHWNSLLGSANAERTDYDKQGRVISQTAFGGDVTTTSYAWNGTLATTGLGTFGGWTQTTSTNADRVSTGDGIANARTAIETSDVFGHVVSKTDMGGHVTGFAYDSAGRVVSSSGGETRLYSYFNTGLAASVSAGTASAAYSYDARGQKLTEYATTGGAAMQNAAATYDALGRMTTWAEAGNAVLAPSTIAWAYDAVGNIRKEQAAFRHLMSDGTVSAYTVSDERWFAYDSMNRVVTAGGHLSGAQIAGGTRVTYDAAGQRATATGTYAGTATVANPNYNPEEPPKFGNQPTITVDYTGRTLERYVHDAAGNLEHVQIQRGGAIDDGAGYVTLTAPSGAFSEKATFAYDAMGRLLRQQDWTGNGTGVAYDRQLTYNAKGQVTYETTAQKQGSDTFTSAVTTHYGSGAGYALGAATQVTTTNAKNGAAQPTTSTVNGYAWYEGAVQASASGHP